MRLSRQEYWSGLPFPSLGYLPDSGIEPGSPTLQADALISEPPGKSTSPREYQIVRTRTKETTWMQDHHPTTSSTLCRTPHLNNKLNKNTNQIISRQDYYLTQPCPSEEKQTNKTSAQISSYRKLTQTTGPTLGGQKPKGRKNSALKPGKRRPQT